MPSQIPHLHTLYCTLTGLALPLDAARERDWFEWLKRIGGGPSSQTLSQTLSIPSSPEAALRLVIAHLQKGIRDGRRNPGALKFRNLIGLPDYFEEDLAEAIAETRKHKPETGGRASALRATGREPLAAPARPARSAAQILEADRAFEEFRKLKEKL